MNSKASERMQTVHHRTLRRELIEIAILGAIGIVMTWAGITCRNCIDTTREFWIVASFTSVTWIFLFKGNQYLAEYLAEKVPWISNPWRPMILGIVATSVYTTIAIHLIGYIYEIAFGANFMFGAIYTIVITIIVSLFMHGRSFLLNWRQSAIEAEKLKKESIAAQYESLKNQVNPHFLFNSLNALTNLVADNEEAVKFIKQLSEVYRYVLDTRDKEIVTLSDEMKFLNSYVFLQQIRFGSKLSININVTDENVFVPPLAIQMLIENAIKHNVVSQDDPLHIEVAQREGYVIVRNRIQRKSSSSEPSAGVGLENIRKRYQFLTSKPVEVSACDNIFEVRLPEIKAPRS